MALQTNTNEAAGAANPGKPVAARASINLGPSNRPTAATELLRAEAGDVSANEIAMERSGAEHVSAERVIMTNSGARTVDARSAQIDRSGILGVRSEKAVLYNSTAVGVMSEDTRIVRGHVFALKTNEATIEGDARIAIYAGPPGACTPLVDTRSAAVFGAALGVMLVTLGAILRRLARRS
ncbi:MAG: hypothetical protein U0031_08805 [Thermomicrobiales bacterium]